LQIALEIGCNALGRLLMVRRLDSSESNFTEAFSSLIHERPDGTAIVDSGVKEIIDKVRMHGDKSLLELTSKLDRFDSLDVKNLLLTKEKIDQSVDACSKETLDAINFASLRIRKFHEMQSPIDINFTDDLGVGLGALWRPISSVGIYVPGGTAAYPSSVLMNAIPAKVAGVPRIAMAVPAPEGNLSPYVIAAAKVSGVDEIWTIGGAQAIAALAYGTSTITPVDKIVGPGNAWVASAKRQVFGQVGIDMIAGPSEILVIADKLNNPDWIAMDLLSQAEHDPTARAILITDNDEFAKKVENSIGRYLKSLKRSDIASDSWKRFGAIILVKSIMEEASNLANQIAPEHLELAVESPDELVKTITNAGAMFIGRFTPEAIGDYVAGPNHVLPTSRSARFTSGLSVIDFLKRTTTVSCDSHSLGAIGPSAIKIAKAEGLEAHALSISLRMDETSD